MGLFVAIAAFFGNETAQLKYKERLDEKGHFRKGKSRDNYGATGGHPGFKLIKRMTRRTPQPRYDSARAIWGAKASAKLRDLAARSSHLANMEKEAETRRKKARENRKSRSIGILSDKYGIKARPRRGIK